MLRPRSNQRVPLNHALPCIYTLVHTCIHIYKRSIHKHENECICRHGAETTATATTPQTCTAGGSASRRPPSSSLTTQVCNVCTAWSLGACLCVCIRYQMRISQGCKASDAWPVHMVLMAAFLMNVRPPVTPFLHDPAFRTHCIWQVGSLP